jgi:hypothetical protein
MWPENVGKFKNKFIHLIGTRTRDFPACSIVSQPSMLPRARSPNYVLWKVPTIVNGEIQSMRKEAVIALCIKYMLGLFVFHVTHCRNPKDLSEYSPYFLSWPLSTECAADLVESNTDKACSLRRGMK